MLHMAVPFLAGRYAFSVLKAKWDLPVMAHAHLKQQ